MKVLNTVNRVVDVAEKGVGLAQSAGKVLLYIKIAIAAAAVLVVTILGAVGYAIFNEANAAVSDGYRMGVVSKFSQKGLFNKSWEGQMLMGREGSPYTAGTGSKKTTINPWYFSASDRVAPSINKLSGEYVWIQYSQDHLGSVTQDTPYNVVDVQPVTRTAPRDSCSGSKNGDSKSEGFRIGRIVKASNKGTFAKTNEVILQMGNSGNQFKMMSVEDNSVYQCAIDFLKSGKQVKVFYTQSLFNFGLEDTSYNIVKIEVIKDL